MDWFWELTGLRDDDPSTVAAKLSVDGPWILAPDRPPRHAGWLEMPGLSDLRDKPRDRGAGIQLSEVVGDIRDLHADPANAGAVFQVASQFNLLEMIGPQVGPEEGIARYAEDLTQGPACAMSCGAGTVYRNYFVPLPGGVGQTTDRQIDCAADLHHQLGGALWDMRNGYLLPRPGGLGRAAEVLGEGDIQDLQGHLRIGVQRDTEVTLPGAGHRVTQVYASACPVAYSGEPAAEWEPLARLILDAAYEATFAAALDADGPLYLTRLGGGAFGNPQDWIAASIRRALDLFRASGLDVRLVSHRGPSGLMPALLG